MNDDQNDSTEEQRSYPWDDVEAARYNLGLQKCHERVLILYTHPSVGKTIKASPPKESGPIWRLSECLPY